MSPDDSAEASSGYEQPIDVLVFSPRQNDIDDVLEAADAEQLPNVLVCFNSMEETLAYLRAATRRGSSEALDEIPMPGLAIVQVDTAEGQALLHEMRTDATLMCTPVVVTMGGMEDAALELAIRHGVTGYFLAPVDPEKLRAVIRDVEDHWHLLMNPPCSN